MNIIDICIILLLIAGYAGGSKNGFSKQLISTVGLLLVLALAYLFKNPISTFMYKYLPFLNIGGKFEGVTSITIIIYEFFAFIVVFSILYIVFKIILKTSSFFEGIITKIPIIGLPSRLLGGLLGVVELYIVIFLILLLFTMPMINIKQIRNSKLTGYILKDTPVLSDYTEDTQKLYKEVYDISLKYKKKPDKEEMNKEIISKLIEYKFITKENVEYLNSKGKIKYTGD